MGYDWDRLYDEAMATLPNDHPKPSFDEWAALQMEQMERRMDELVYQLYGLTEDEIALVEGRVPPSPAWVYGSIEPRPRCERCYSTEREIGYRNGSKAERCRQCRVFYPPLMED